MSKIVFGGPGIASTESATVIGWSRAWTSALPLTNDPASSDIVMKVNMAGPASHLGVEYYGDEVSLRQALINVGQGSILQWFLFTNMLIASAPGVLWMKRGARPIHAKGPLKGRPRRRWCGCTWPSRPGWCGLVAEHRSDPQRAPRHEVRRCGRGRRCRGPRSPIAGRLGPSRSCARTQASVCAHDRRPGRCRVARRLITYGTKHDGLNPFSHKGLRPSSLFGTVNPQINAPTFSGRSS